MEEQLSEQMSDRFDEELGTYVGPLTLTGAMKALAEHTPGELPMKLTAPDGKVLWVKNGESCLVENQEEMMYMVSSKKEQIAGNPAMHLDVFLVLHFSKDFNLVGECAQYTGGLVFRFAFGDYKGHTLKMLAWPSSFHLTPPGDLEPGVGVYYVTDPDPLPSEDESQPDT